jgi:hypothetical protein
MVLYLHFTATAATSTRLDKGVSSAGETPSLQHLGAFQVPRKESTSARVREQAVGWTPPSARPANDGMDALTVRKRGLRSKRRCSG